jgi:hypothetical protein
MHLANQGINKPAQTQIKLIISTHKLKHLTPIEPYKKKFTGDPIKALYNASQMFRASNLRAGRRKRELPQLHIFFKKSSKALPVAEERPKTSVKGCTCESVAVTCKGQTRTDTQERPNPQYPEPVKCYIESQS